MIGLLTVVVAVTEVTAISVARRLAEPVYVGVAVCIAVTTTALAILVARRRRRAGETYRCARMVLDAPAGSLARPR